MLFGIVFLLLLVALGLAAMYLDRIVKVGVESVAPGITQTSVTLAGVSLSPLSGAASLKGLVIGNPAGYQGAQAIRFGQVAIRVEPASILHDKVIIHAIEIREPEINFEGNPLGENNLKKILENVNAKAAADTATTKVARAKSAGKKLQVDDFLLTGAKVHGQIKTPFLNQEISLTLPDIHVSQLGQGPEGITAVELSRKILDQITETTIKSLGNNLAKTGKNLLQEAAKNPADAANILKHGLNGLFKK